MDGKQKWKYFGKGVEAEKAGNEFNDGLKASGQIRTYKKRSKTFGPTLTELVDAYLKSKAATLPAVSLRNTRYKFESVILPLVGHYKAMKLTPDILDRYVANRSKNVKMTTVHRELSDIQACLNWSVKRRLISHNPVHGYEKPSRDDAVIRPPSPEEIKAILAHAPEHLKRALTISYFTGLRPGNAELFRLTWGDVDMVSGYINIVSAKKGGIRERSIPLHPSFKKTLEKWHKSDNGRGHLVHYGKKRKPISTIKTTWASTKKKAGITRRLRPYDFRHAFATAILSSGGDLKATSEMLGHTRPDTTLKVYQHTNSAMHKANIDRLPDIDQ
ncbi:tyrosine-type recombinase/integrase [Desulfosarcina variabilis]|uniref:tyrosine-type recombinase/integrase n=1 Tax=Desulfosarcina variabilis TaxID=2300 RepID=UPI003AFA4C4C